jgi:hypothetical protein
MLSNIIIAVLLVVVYLLGSFLYSLFGINSMMGPSREPTRVEKFFLAPFTAFLWLLKKVP